MVENNKNYLSFSLEPINVPVINDNGTVRVRLKAFHIGHNRNGSVISKEFGEQLIKSSVLRPVVGRYSKDENDFTTHSQWNVDKVKAYGFAPQDLNFEWQMFKDDDGIEREYACIDVILWTNYWEEAKKIPGHAHSMELDETSVEGDWGDDYFYYFTKGAINAFCVLGTIEGEAVEPCFPGSKFGGVQFSSNLTKKEVDSIFMRSTAELVAALGEATQFMNQAVAGGEEMNNQTADVKVTDFAEYNNLLNEKANLETTVQTLQAEKVALEASLEEANNEVSEYEQLQQEVEVLRQFKQEVITKEKEEMISEFTGKIGDAELAEIRAAMAEFETSALQEKLFAKAYVFSMNNPAPANNREEENENESVTDKVIGTEFSKKESVPSGDTDVDIMTEIDALLQ